MNCQSALGRMCRTQVEGETDVLGRPRDDATKANIMKADQARKVPMRELRCVAEKQSNRRPSIRTAVAEGV